MYNCTWSFLLKATMQVKKLVMIVKNEEILLLWRQHFMASNECQNRSGNLS